MKELKCGDIVMGSRHEYLMTIHEVNGYVATCNYFVEYELFTEDYFLDELSLEEV